MEESNGRWVISIVGSNGEVDFMLYIPDDDNAHLELNNTLFPLVEQLVHNRLHSLSISYELTVV